MNARKVDEARFRMSLAGASAIGQLDQVLKNDGVLCDLDGARYYVAEWHAAKAELDAAIHEETPVRA